MLKIHQPYKSKYIFAFVSIGVLLLGSLIIVNSTSESSVVYAAGDSRTIHDISNMQDTTQQICSNTDIGDTEMLKDSRDPNSYTVVKLEDGNCWMQENLRLTGNKTLTPNNSNVSSDWYMPATLTSLISTSFSAPGGYYVAESYYDANTSITNGVYYSFTAATAGTATKNVTSGDVGGVKGNSVCPKGWKLPTSSEYGTMLSKASINNDTDGSAKITGNKYKFSYAGHVQGGSLGFAGFFGYYWSSTVYNSDSAYHLFFSSKNVYMNNDETRYFGYPVRCVAPGGLEKIEKPTWTKNKDGNVTVTMPSVISIDAASGMDKTADAAKVIEGTATATISSNAEYNISIHSTQPSLKDPKVSSAEILPVSESNPVKSGNNAWGLWDGSGDVNNKTYTLPMTNTPQDLYNSKETVTNTEGNPATKHTYYVGISISPALPSGTYATDVIVTASAR